MKLSHIAKPVFLEALSRWATLASQDRRWFVDAVQPPTGIGRGDPGSAAPALLDAGLLVELKGRYFVPDRYVQFWRTMRALAFHQIYLRPDRQAFFRYVHDALTLSELEALRGDRYRFDVQDSAMRLTTTEDWLTGFLTSNAEAWERPYVEESHAARFTDGSMVEKTRALVTSLKSGPVPLLALAEAWKQTPRWFEAALEAAMRYLLVYPGLTHDLELVVGIWPGLYRRMERKARAKAPLSAVQPEKEFFSPVLVDDMAAALAASAAEPPRLRADGSLFAQHERRLAGRLVPAPAWAAPVLGLDIERRISKALWYLQEMDFAHADLDCRLLQASDAGLRWLRQPAKERLRTVLDWHNGQRLAPEERSYGHVVGSAFLPRTVSIPSGDKASADIDGEVAAHFAELPTECFVALGPFLDRRKRPNPLLAILRSRPYGYWSVGRYALNEPGEDELEEAWRDLLWSFFLERLATLGCVRIGIASQGGICARLTETGRYFLGLAPDFQYDLGESPAVVVQPNFDVVFLVPSPRVEVEIGRFAERVGTGVGVLFRITRQAALNAAGAGLSAAEAIGTLRQVSTQALPANVVREMEGWFGQARRASLRPAVLLECPDAETAARVSMLPGVTARSLTPTILEVAEPAERPALIKKLLKAGVFVS